MASLCKTVASCVLLASLLPFLLLASSLFLLFFLPFASLFLSFALLHSLTSPIPCPPNPPSHLLCQNVAHSFSQDLLHPLGFLDTNGLPQEECDHPTALASPAPLLLPPVHLSRVPNYRQCETQDGEPLCPNHGNADLSDFKGALNAENPDEVSLPSVLPDAVDYSNTAQGASDNDAGEPNLRASTEKNLIVCNPETICEEESFHEILSPDSSLDVDGHSFTDARDYSQVLEELSSQVGDTEMEGRGAAECSQLPDDQVSDVAPPEAEGLSVEEGSEVNDELASEDQADVAQAMDMISSDWLDANGTRRSAIVDSRRDGIEQENTPAISDEQASTNFTNNRNGMMEEQPPNDSIKVEQSSGAPESESWKESLTIEDKQEDSTSSHATSRTESIKEPIVDANNIEVRSSKEMTLLAEINDIKKILGYHGDPHASLAEQIRALNILVGITPSDVGNVDDLEIELEVLRAVIGVN